MARLRRILLASAIGLASLWAAVDTAVHLLQLVPPVPPAVEVGEAVQAADSLRVLGNAWYRQGSHGLWEAYIEGAPYERGVAFGRLAERQIREQEHHFIAQVRRLVPSEVFLRTLRYGITWFNRHIDRHISPELREECLGVSLAFTDEYDFIGSKYSRILNYHAAHDIGHALQDLSIVGCTSFAAWGSSSADSGLIIGRNFDFYMGDDFSRDKLVLFVRPDSGYAFASVTWAGFMGVVSGMNEHGLCVTLNAAKSSVPTAAKTPISALAREILQYARNIGQAYAIARSRETFVSESILIGSAEDGQAAIIEKSPDAIGLYRPDGSTLVCSNHYQGDALATDPVNLQNIALSDSRYRFDRKQQLIDMHVPITPSATAAMLRDRQGLDGAELGMGNPKAINQMLAHHGIIFQPHQRRMWVSANPWQMGAFVCYDLSGLRDGRQGARGEHETQGSPVFRLPGLDIPADPFLQTAQFQDFLFFKEVRQELFMHLVLGRDLDWDGAKEQRFIASNPHSYLTHQLLGDLYAKRKDRQRAMGHYQQALSLEVASEADREMLRRALAKMSEG